MFTEISDLSIDRYGEDERAVGLLRFTNAGNRGRDRRDAVVQLARRYGVNAFAVLTDYDNDRYSPTYGQFRQAPRLLRLEGEPRAVAEFAARLEGLLAELEVRATIAARAYGRWLRRSPEAALEWMPPEHDAARRAFRARVYGELAALAGGDAPTPDPLDPDRSMTHQARQVAAGLEPLGEVEPDPAVAARLLGGWEPAPARPDASSGRNGLPDFVRVELRAEAGGEQWGVTCLRCTGNAVAVGPVHRGPDAKGQAWLAASVHAASHTRERLTERQIEQVRALGLTRGHLRLIASAEDGELLLDGAGFFIGDDRAGKAVARRRVLALIRGGLLEPGRQWCGRRTICATGYGSRALRVLRQAAREGAVSLAA